jgi:hypothetical protein
MKDKMEKWTCRFWEIASFSQSEQRNLNQQKKAEESNLKNERRNGNDIKINKANSKRMLIQFKRSKVFESTYDNERDK